MPKLQDNRKTVEVALDHIPEGKVSVYDSMLGSDVEKLVKRGNDAGLVFPLSLLIKEWNLTDENDQALPVTEENISRLDARDLNKIVKATNITADFFGEGKG